MNNAEALQFCRNADWLYLFCFDEQIVMIGMLAGSIATTLGMSVPDLYAMLGQGVTREALEAASALWAEHYPDRHSRERHARTIDRILGDASP